MEEEVWKLIRTAQKHTVLFLEKTLPSIGGEDWWKRCVRWKLTENQEHHLDERGITELKGLDLAALLRVIDKNWREVSSKRNLPREGRTLANELHNIRNRFAHHSLQGVSLEDLQRDSDTIARYLRLIKADESAINEANSLRDNCLRRLVAGESLTAVSTELDQERPEPEPIEESKLSSEPLGGTSGVPVTVFRPKSKTLEIVDQAMTRATYVGIDFGTSTTVASVIKSDGGNKQLESEPIAITQWTETGLQIDDHLLPSCLAWVEKKKKLLVGRGAVDLQPHLAEGRNLWSSFKMQLGIDLGPQYPHSKLARGLGPKVIEKPIDAARIFFEYIRESIEDHVQDSNLPPRIYYAISVPASFEANQRQDLIKSLVDAGISVDEANLIDEPNAAFLSYLVEMEKQTSGKGFIDSLAKKKLRVMVFDFGAGTCDISVLEIMVEEGRLSSRNLSISKFMALGGNDIDRAIASQVLLPQLCNGQNPTDLFTTRELEAFILPLLKPAAEALKIQCSKLAQDSGFSTLADLCQKKEDIWGPPVRRVKLKNQTWELKNPKISLVQFAKVMEAFLGKPSSGDQAHHEPTSVHQPVGNALEKAKLAYSDLDMILFIGGSSENPLVRSAIEERAGRFVDCVTPRDLRSHVSQGAAVHSFFIHGLGFELIQPITSEPIYVVTRNECLEQVLPAGSLVPTPKIFETELRVDRERQEWIELPFCVSGRQKILAIVKIPPPISPGYFINGETVHVSCMMTREKLLHTSVHVGDKTVTVRIINPLANTELNIDDRAWLESRQKLNEAILEGKGRPTHEVLLNYAYATEEAGRYREAAETFEQVEQLTPDSDFSTTIAYNYSKSGDLDQSDKWSEVAYERSPGTITAYNLALARNRDDDHAGYEELMEESLKFSDNNTATLNAYGHYLKGKGDPRGLSLVGKACDLLKEELESGTLSKDDVGKLRRTATTLGKKDILKALDSHCIETKKKDALIQEDYLVVGSKPTMLPG